MDDAIIPFLEHSPVIHESAFVAPDANVIGKVWLGERSNVWFKSVLRGDIEPIRIGARSNIQDLCCLHTAKGYPVVVGEDVTVGHNVMLHGCTVEDWALIGMGAIVLNGAKVGRGAIVGAGAVVPEGFEVPPETLVLGVPAKVVRKLTEEDLARVRQGVQNYLDRAEIYRAYYNRTNAQH